MRPYYSLEKDSFRQISRSLASMHESSGSHFLRTTTGIQSEPDAFNNSRLIMTFLTNLGFLWILNSFRLVIEGETDIEIFESSTFEFLKAFCKQLLFIRGRRQHLRSIKGGGITDLPLLRTLLASCQKLREPSF